MAEGSGQKVTVITVHGTGDTAKDLDGEKWFQRGSTFVTRMSEGLRAQGLEPEIIPLLWSGANSARAREQGADKLADAIKHHSKDGPVHIIGHSHGGNVANEAVDFLRWGRRRGKKQIASVTTVGTPYFKNTTGAAEAFAGLVFLGLTVLSALAVILISIVILIMMATGELERTQEAVIGIIAIGAPTMIGVFFMLRLSLEGARRILRPARKGTDNTSIHTIWHKNDEAIAFLQKVEELPIEVFPRWSMLRGSRGAAIVWGVRAVLILAALATYALVHKPFGLPTPPVFHEGPGDFGVPDSMAYAVLLTPLIFSGVYLAYRFFFGLIPELTVRGAANKTVAGLLRGLAFGKDGDQRLASISPTSHTHESEDVVLDGPVAERMQTNAAGAAGRLIEKYRWALFTVGADTNASVTAMATDAMTWDSLIHTTYFDQPEVAKIVADYIARKAKEA